MEVKFAGRIFNKVTNAGLKNQEVNVTLDKNGICLICISNNKVGSVKTGSDGRFNLAAIVDSTLLKEGHFTVSVKTPDDYILYPEPVGPSFVNTPRYSSVGFYELEPARMEDISFEFYPKALLKINLHRMTPISPGRSLGLEFTINDRVSVWGLAESSTNADTSLTINTSASMYTKIASRKFISADSVKSRIDSVYCMPNQTNSIDMYY